MSSQYPICPNCKQTETVQPASNANISVPPKPSDTVVKLVKIWRWIFGSMFGLLVLILACGLLLGGCSVLLAGSQDETGFASLVGGYYVITSSVRGTSGLGILWMLFGLDSLAYRAIRWSELPETF